ncbi:MAG: hypothetical protein KDE58_18070, partial [Caldilineaceae bacterium]|nr:hypothetical protein [Caldilineaceae bacterium]
SERERRIRELLDTYKAQMHGYFDLLGPAQLRRRFAQIPLAERKLKGHNLLGMYRGRADWEQAIDHCFAEWETGAADALGITEAKLLLIIQLAYGWSDRRLAEELDVDMAHFDTLTATLVALKRELATLLYVPTTLTRLQNDGFTTRLDMEALKELQQNAMAATARTEAVKDCLATTIVGLYDGLRDWYRRTGEGRVASVKAVIAAERVARDISGVIIFDRGHHLAWRRGVCRPGYQGVAGLFSELLGDTRETVMAVLSNEMYLSYDPSDPITHRIAEFIHQEIMQGEIAHAIFNLFVSGLGLPSTAETDLRARFFERIAAFVPTLMHMHAARPSVFHRVVLGAIRKAVKRMKLGISGDRLLARMHRHNLHLTQLLRTFNDYGLLAVHFQEAHLATVEQVSGARQPFFVVTMPGDARRKQLMYDLTARIVDAETLPVTAVIVSSWARTGWNVIRPNLLIDATATRDVTAWQQLRGRAIRARRTWNNDCYRLLSILIGHHLLAGQEMSADELEYGPLDDALFELLAAITSPEVETRIRMHGIGALSDSEREQLSVALMINRNKVTHIYELVKAAGSGSQVLYDRHTKRWQRRESIAAKHAREIGVDIFSGQKVTGEGHAPLLYVQDPRTDVPAELQVHLQNAIDDRDAVLVSGWLEHHELM